MSVSAISSIAETTGRAPSSPTCRSESRAACASAFPSACSDRVSQTDESPCRQGGGAPPRGGSPVLPAGARTLGPCLALEHALFRVGRLEMGVVSGGVLLRDRGRHDLCLPAGQSVAAPFLRCDRTAAGRIVPVAGLRLLHDHPSPDRDGLRAQYRRLDAVDAVAPMADRMVSGPLVRPRSLL